MRRNGGTNKLKINPSMTQNPESRPQLLFGGGDEALGRSLSGDRDDPRMSRARDQECVKAEGGHSWSAELYHPLMNVDAAQRWEQCP
jgi:hypothetical protein